MNGEQYKELMARYNFDEWRNRNTLDENLFIWQFFFRGDEFPNWKPHQIRVVNPPPAEEGLRSLAEEAGDTPRLIQSVWRPSTGRADAAFTVDSYECSSREKAHELLIRILGEFQSPLAARQAETSVGDVTFVHPGNGIVLFVRANHVIVVRSIGVTTVPVMELAEQLDSDLIGKPVSPVSLMKPDIRFLETQAAELQVGSRVPLEIEAPPSAGEALMYKFFAREGEVIAEEGKLIYTPSAPGEQDLEVYAVAPDRGAGTSSLRFIVK